MLILSLDSAGSGCGACVWRDGKTVAEEHERMERGQDQRLMPLILEVMQKAGAGFSGLDRIAVTRGPGSFTGLRIGLAAARGIGLAAGKPVIGIDRFALYRLQVQAPHKSLLVVTDSRRKELFCRFYPSAGVAMESTMMNAGEIASFIARKGDTAVTGDIPVEGVGFHPIHERETVTCARLAAIADPKSAHFLPRPLYIRAPDVTLAGAA
jgi:tRNA threonylcarbamoyladenosine biosynthesis protein TsaB